MFAGALALLGTTAWTGSAAGDGPIPAPPTELVERTRGAWIDIYTEWLGTRDGRGVAVDPSPAFCLGTDGFVAIDQNPVAGSLHQFATIRGRGPFAARLRAFDPGSGLAAIQINPKTLEGARCLQSAGADAAPLAQGDVLFALGPAGAQPVALRVKKVTQDALIFVGGVQETLLAGSPLVDANGLLRGVLVAGTKGGTIGREHATGALAGLAHRRRASQAIPLAPALALVEQVRKQREEGKPMPPASPIVRVSEGVFPNTLRTEPAVSAEDLALYTAKTDDAGVEFLTPTSLAAQAQRLPIYFPGRRFFCFGRHVEMWEPMVVVQQAPQFVETGATGYSFLKSQGTITVMRGDERIDPFDSFVDCLEDSIGMETEPGTYALRKVKGCRTFYLFPPTAFAPGAEVVVLVPLDKAEKTARVPVRPETQERIAADFAPWQAAAGKSAEEPTSDAELVLVPTPGVPYAMNYWGDPRLQIFTPEAYTYFATRSQRDGATVISVPLILMKWGPTMAFGFLVIGRDEISFEPVGDPKAEGFSFMASRASVTFSTSFWPRLEIKAGGKSWNFDPVVSGMRKLSIGEILFGAAMKEAKTASVRMSAWLLGDFDRALRAFDEPELLKDITAIPEAHEEPAPEDAP
jgi:hypothetical protein